MFGPGDKASAAIAGAPPGDIGDSWNSMANIGFSQDGHEKYAAGHWNDPDMLVVGIVGWGNTHPSHLTPVEQQTHITLWSLLSARYAPVGLRPVETRSLHDRADEQRRSPVESIRIRSANLPGVKAKQGSSEVWARPLSDGTIAVGLFNRGSRSSRSDRPLGRNRRRGQADVTICGGKQTSANSPIRFPQPFRAGQLLRQDWDAGRAAVNHEDRM